ncbi:M16 family metallopeptidase [Burkholderiaceae bacterium UC74_6]
MVSSKRFCLAWVAALALALGFTSTVRAAEPELVRQLAGFSEYRLANGLQVILLPVAGSGRTWLTVTYKVGSRMEGPNEAGMAHLLEHVTFRGASAADGQPLEIGAEFKKLPISGQNGTTTLDRTNYFENFVADPAVLDRALALEALRMRSARLDAADFEKEKPIVLNEMGMRGEGAVRQMVEALAASAFKLHPYRLPTIGNAADIEQLSLGRLRTFYDKYYRPDNAVLMLAGEFDAATVLQAVQKNFGALANPAGAVPELNVSEPAQAGPRLVTLRTQQSTVGVAYRVPAMAHPQAAAVAVMGAMLSGIRSNLIAGQGDVGTGVTVPLRMHDPFLTALILPMPRAASGDDKSREALTERARDWAEALERADLSGSKDETATRFMIVKLRNDLRGGLRDPGIASALISDAVGAGDWRLPLRLLDDLGHLTPRDVRAAFDTYVRPENRSLAIGVTDKHITEPQFAEEKVGGLRGWFSKPSKIAEVQDAGATIGALDKAGQQIGSTGGTAYELDPAKLDRDVQRVKLPSGALLALLKRQSVDDRVQLQLLMRWGDAPSLAAEPGWRALVPELFEGGIDGQSRFSREQIARAKTSMQLQYSLRSGPQLLIATLSVPREHVIPALALLRGLLRDPAFDADAFKRVKDQALTRLAASRRSADWAPELARQHHMQAQGLYANRAGYEPSVQEQIEIWNKLDLATARAFWKRYWSANELQVSAVGPLPDNFYALVEGSFGDWKKPEAPAFERWVPGYKPEPGARFVSSVRAGAADGSQASANIVFQQELPLNANEPDAFAMLLGARILAGGHTSGSRLADRLRAQDAISYNVDYNLRVPEHGNAGALRLSAIAAPAHAAAAETAMREEIARLLQDGVTAAELEEVKRQFRTARGDLLRNDAALNALLLAQLDKGEGFADMAAREEAGLAAATVESVNGALRRLLKPDRWVVVVTGASKEEVPAAAASVKAP